MRDCDVSVNEILKSYKRKVFVMANRELADEIMEELKARGYMPVMVVQNKAEYIAVTKSAKKKLLALVDKYRERAKQEIQSLEQYRVEVVKSL